MSWLKPDFLGSLSAEVDDSSGFLIGTGNDQSFLAF